jgi:hypothetical protein
VDINFVLQQLVELFLFQKRSLDNSSPRSIVKNISPRSCEFQDDQQRKTKKEEEINRN